MKKKVIIIFLFIFIFIGQLCIFNLVGAASVEEADQRVYIGEYTKKEGSIIIETKALYNDMDSVIYMVKEIERYALNFNGNSNIVNLVLSYLRTIHKGYNGMGWFYVTGASNQNFIDYVNLNDNSNFKIKEFFACFVSSGNYNEEDFGTLAQGHVQHELEVIDPVNPHLNKNNMIDIIHMFASLDGLYKHSTPFYLPSLEYNFQHDVAGWAGDIQTLVYDNLYDKGKNPMSISDLKQRTYKDNTDGLSNDAIDFGDLLQLNNGNSFSNPDMLADLDSYNIAVLYLNKSKANKLSFSMEQYYIIVNEDNDINGGNRYALFIETMTTETCSKKSNIIDKFKEEVFYALNLKVKKSGQITNRAVWPFPYTYLGYYQLRGNKIIGGTMPDIEYRKIAANLFIDYIIEMSTPATQILKHNNIMTCRSEAIVETVSVPENIKLKYDIDIVCDHQYWFRVDAISLIKMTLYDSEMNKIYEESNTESRRYIDYRPNLTEGKYFMVIEHRDNEQSDINVALRTVSKLIETISQGQTKDALRHLHFNENEFSFVVGETGFYKISLNAELDDDYLDDFDLDEIPNELEGEEYKFTYPSGTLIIKDIYGFVVDKYILSVNNNGISIDGANNLIFYGDKFKKYFIYIDFDESYLKSLSLNVQDCNIIQGESLNSNDEYYNSQQIENGDFLEVIQINRSGEYNINILYDGNHLSNSFVFILKRFTDGSYSVLDSFPVTKMENINTTIRVDDTMTVYLIFFNLNAGNLITEIEKNVNNTFELNTDLNPNVTVGSEVSMNGGGYCGTTITVGYTRICYLGKNAPNTTSRTLYYWRSTNSNVAIVSDLGTITAVGVGTVIIQAIYKADPSIVGYITITVLRDYNSSIMYLKYGMDVREGGTIAGTEVTSGKGVAIAISQNPEVIIHTGKTRLICLGNDSPTTSPQHFNWEITRQAGETGSVSVSAFGTITAIVSGEITITGTYLYNPRFKVVIKIIVHNNIDDCTSN